MKLMKSLVGGAVLAALPTLTLAQDAPVNVAASTDTVFILNSLLFLMAGFLVFWMAAGFSMLEAGLVRGKNVAMQLTKNMGLFSLAAIFYYLIGYNLMYPLGLGASKVFYLAFGALAFLKQLALPLMQQTTTAMQQLVLTFSSS